MKRLFLTGVASLFLATGTAHAQSASNIQEMLAKELHKNGDVMKCGDLTISSPDGKQLKGDGADGIFKITADANDIYVGGKRCEFRKILCSKQTSC